MKWTTSANLILKVSLVAFLSATVMSAQSLKVLTFNIWSGLDYKGTLSVGEHETEERREERFQALIDGLRQYQPDVIALQEVNPVYSRSDDIADSLGYDRIFLRSEAGMKFGGFGIPTNMDEGLVILARKELQLAWLSNIDVSQGFGGSGNTFALHFSERSDAIVGRIIKDDIEILIVNTHLTSAVPDRADTRSRLREILTEKGIEDTDDHFTALKEGSLDRERQVRDLVSRLKEEYPDAPIILAGDFNAEPSSPEIQYLLGETDFVYASGEDEDPDLLTWDPAGNSNTRYSTEISVDDIEDSDPLEILSAWYDRKPRRIDYVFLNQRFGQNAANSPDRVFDIPTNGLFPSDHYGMMVTIDLSTLASGQQAFGSPGAEFQSSSYDILPIAAYDTDVGFGFGLKTFFLNYLGYSESVDLILFASTKGERLIRVVFSTPDFELRQGTVYPLSFDILVDYDKFLANPFFGVGNGTDFQDRETYTKEPLEISAVFGRGFSSRFVAQLGAKFKTVRNFNFADTSLFAYTPPALNQGKSNSFMFVASARYDSRDSFINPSYGNVAQLDFEYGRKGTIGDFDITSTKVTLMGYRPFLFSHSTLALRVMGQVAQGDELPVYALPSLGGGSTLRGYSQDRFLDKVMLVTNVEFRYPITYRISGVLGLDAGNVWNKPSEVDFSAWPWSGVIGIRLHLDTFLARADVGVSKESSGFYLSFGHTF